MSLRDRMSGVTRLAAGFVILIGITVLFGYELHSRAIVSLAPGLQGMSVLTATSLLAVSAALLATSWKRTLIARSAAAVAVAIGAILLGLGLWFGHDPINPTLAFRLFGFDPSQAGKTSPATAACVVLLGTAALVRGKTWVADLLGVATLVISGLALLGYAYGVRDLYALPVFRTIALHTALALFLLSLSSLLLTPKTGVAAIVTSGGPGGRTTRRLLAFTLAPPLLGVVLLRATDAHHLGPSAAMAFLVALTILPLAFLILRDGRVLNELEAERQHRAELQAALSQDLEATLAVKMSELEAAGEQRAKAEQLMYRTQRLETLGQLTGGIAHDFNNLLMAIGGNLQLLAKRLPEDHPARRYAVNAQTATDKGAKLTAQLLAFSRTQKLDVRPVELDATLNGARALLGNALGPNVEVTADLAAPGAWALTDPDQLELAILNLALNARDAMADGGRLTVESAPCCATLAGEGEEGDYLAIRVRDTGTGMSPDIAAQAIEPFFTTKERGKGTGLGLSQVYGFVRQCGGELRIESAPGQGTTVELLLPRGLPPDSHATAPEPIADQAPAPVQPGRRLLLVIDDDSVRSVLVDALSTAGFEVIEARDGSEGLKLLEGRAPAAAIIDFLMPGLNGAEVARLAQTRRPGLPIIFVSGFSDTVALDGIAGAVVLRKPFDVERLQQTVSSVLH